MNETPYDQLQETIRINSPNGSLVRLDETAVMALISIAHDLHEIAHYTSAVTMEAEGFPQAVKIWPLGS